MPNDCSTKQEYFNNLRNSIDFFWSKNDSRIFFLKFQGENEIVLMEFSVCINFFWILQHTAIKNGIVQIPFTWTQLLNLFSLFFSFLQHLTCIIQNKINSVHVKRFSLHFYETIKIIELKIIINNWAHLIPSLAAFQLFPLL